jgi:tRNA (Thr-GGU) A37 N-methylase
VFNRPNKICLYDLKVTTIDRRILDRRQVNFCKVSTYTITN